MTDYIIGSRRSGKSTALIKKIIGTEGDILVIAPNTRMAELLEKNYKRYMLTNNIIEYNGRTVSFKSAESLGSRIAGMIRPVPKVMIDEFNECRLAPYFAKEDVIAATITMDSNDTVRFLNGNFSDKIEIGDVSPWEKSQPEDTRKK